jgi:putative DNA primase/helicase
MRELRIACGTDFYAAPKQQTFSWPSLVNLLSGYAVGEETLAEFVKLPKATQLKLKDVGWYNGNTYRLPVRLTENIESASLLTLDVDSGPADSAARIAMAFDPDYTSDGFAHFVGSTRKHTPQKPKLRIVIPLTRDVTVDEADALTRMLAFRVGMTFVDLTCFRRNQVMFWPSRCIDGAIFTETVEGAWLDPDAALDRWYLDWTDRADWPLHPDEDKQKLTHERRKAEDPTTKEGAIGEWCRTFTITDAIERFLSDRYETGSNDHRFTHVGSTGVDGAIVYEDKWLYSNHATDPACGRLLNAWDLVRVHLFGELDAKVRPGAAVSRVPSSKAMEEFARKQPEFKKALAQQAIRDFTPVEQQGDVVEGERPTGSEATDLTAQLTFNRAGQIEATLENIHKILTQNPITRGGLAFNHNTGAVVWRRFMPWHDDTRRTQRIDEVEGLGFRDIDEIRIRDWLQTVYRIEPITLQKIHETVLLVADQFGFHPIRDQLARLKPWDGKPRLDTLFIRYLNMPDTPYARHAARIFLVGAVKRIMEPGCKFDTMPVLIGPQRIKKSAFVEALAGRASWFSDELPKLGKEAVEHIRSLWFCEVAELAQFKHAETEFIKAFLSRRMDRARLSYERHSAFYPRQCVFVGTTNNSKPLKDPTGNGRYLPIRCIGFVPQTVMIDVDSLRLERDQLFAEAIAAWSAGEDIYLRDARAIEGAKEAQEDAQVEDPFESAVEDWLEGGTPSIRLPAHAGVEFTKAGRRDRVCVAMVACEALGYDPKGIDWPPWLSGRISDYLHARGDFEQPKHPARIQHYGKPRVFERVNARIEVLDDL